MANTSISSAGSSLYFGYGSNMWIHQMNQRCPESELIGLGKLNDWYWLINGRHYANVVEVTEQNPPLDTKFPDSWGLVYKVTPKDLARLDINEGVPKSYIRKQLQVDLWDMETIKKQKTSNTRADPTSTDMWVYIDTRRTKPSYPYKEYIYRMNMGISDALPLGLPDDYITEVLRAYIPASEVEGDEKLIAQKQAKDFQDPRIDPIPDTRT